MIYLTSCLGNANKDNLADKAKQRNFKHQYATIIVNLALFNCSFLNV